MPTIDLNGLSNPQNDDILLFSKSTWASAWSHQANAIVEEIVWSIAPQVSAATFQWRYGGNVNAPGGSGLPTINPLSGRGDYILILQPLGGGSYLPWLGYADTPVIIEEDDVSGIQRVPCFGFDRALQYATIVSTVHVDPDDDTAWLRKDRGAVFNGLDKGDRKSAMVKLDPADANPSVYVFELPNVESRDWWSSQDILQHLAIFHLPTATQIPGTLPWTIVGDDRLPDWDHPRLETEGRSIHECLTELAGPERMLGWRVMPTVAIGGDPLTTPPTVSAINIEFFTHASAAISLPGVTNLPANHNQLTITHDEDPLTDSTIDEDDTNTVDQVIVRGPREVAVGTFRWSSEWVAGWTATELSEYNAAFSGEVFWAGKSLTEKRELNQFFRAQNKYADVYRTFPIKDDWDGTCNSENLFWKPTAPDPDYVPYLGNVEFMDRLPLLIGIDYSGDISTVDESRGRRTLPILVFIERPDASGKYKPVQSVLTDFGGPRIKHPNSLDFEMRIRPYKDRGPGFQIDVLGAPQHAHRGTSFIPNDGDPENTNPKMWGEIDSETMLITAAMIGDRRPEVRLPASVSADFVRRKYITLEHDGLRHIHIAAGTVVSADKDSLLNTSDGGTLRDPFVMLTALATLASERWLTPRKTAKIRSGRPINVETGSLITSINGATVDAVISEVRVSTPVVESDSPPPFRMDIQAIDNEFDITNLIARVPQPEVDR